MKTNEIITNKKTRLACCVALVKTARKMNAVDAWQLLYNEGEILHSSKISTTRAIAGLKSEIETLETEIDAWVALESGVEKTVETEIDEPLDDETEALLAAVWKNI